MTTIKPLSRAVAAACMTMAASAFAQEAIADAGRARWLKWSLPQPAARRRSTRSRAPSPSSASRTWPSQYLIADDPSQALSTYIPGYAPSRQKMSSTGESLRGRQPLILLDGIPQSNPLRAGMREGYFADSFIIERIEVINGASAVQGMGATGGIINYITKAPRANGTTHGVNLRASTQFRSDNLDWKTGYSISHKSDAFDFLGYAGRAAPRHELRRQRPPPRHRHRPGRHPRHPRRRPVRQDRQDLRRPAPAAVAQPLQPGGRRRLHERPGQRGRRRADQLAAGHPGRRAAAQQGAQRKPRLPPRRPGRRRASAPSCSATSSKSLYGATKRRHLPGHAHRAERHAVRPVADPGRQARRAHHLRASGHAGQRPRSHRRRRLPARRDRAAPGDHRPHLGAAAEVQFDRAVRPARVRIRPGHRARRRAP